MKYIVDRIESEYAICEAEDRSMTDIPICDLPSGIKEGDHIGLDGGIYSILPTDYDRKKRVKSLMDDLWN
jgi:hypothetical protein